MNKSQFIEALAAHFEGNKKAASKALDSVVDTIAREVAKGEKVAITGFGAFEKAVRPSRMVRNPATGERVRAKKTAVPKFRAGADLKAVVSGAKKLPKLTVAKATSTARGAAAKTTSSPKKAAKKSTSSRGPAKKSTSTKKSTASKSTAKKSPAKKSSSAAKSTAAKSASSRSTAKKSTTAKSTAKKSTAKKSSPSKSTASKSTAKKSPAKKTAKKS